MYHNSFTIVSQYDLRSLAYESAMDSKMADGSHLGFEIQLMSLDIFFLPMALRNCHAKWDICIMT